MLAIDDDLVRERRHHPVGDRGRRYRLRPRSTIKVNSSPPRRARKAPCAAVSRRLATSTQQGVPDGMAEDVVDLLEAVEIEEQHGEARPVLPGLLDGRRETRRESRAVRQIRQPVEMGEVLDALLGALALGDVLGDAEQILRLVVLPRTAMRFVVTRRVPLCGVWIGSSSTMSSRSSERRISRSRATSRVGHLLRQEVVIVLADQLVARHAEQLLAGAVDEHVAELLRLLDEQHRRHVLDDGVEEGARCGADRPRALRRSVTSSMTPST